MSSNRNNYDSIQGQVAIVTGGGSGLGRAFALALSSAGAIVTVTGRSSAQLTETVTQISAAGGRALAITADVTDQDAIIQLVTAVEHQFGPVDLLINNAGIISPIGPLWQIIPNILDPMNCTHGRARSGRLPR